MKFIFNAQHDCVQDKCPASGQCTQIQELLHSGVVEVFVEHKGDKQFIINMAAFHNAHLICNALPRSLVTPIPLFDNRQKKHDKLAAPLQAIKGVKRNAQKAKRAADKAAKAGDVDGSSTAANSSKKRKISGAQMVNWN